MASYIVERTTSDLHVVDLGRVRARELASLWDREIRLWRDELGWDVSAAVSALERAVDRGGLCGKAVRYGGVIVGYSYYAVEGDRGVISGLVMSPSFGAPEAGAALLTAMVDELERRRVRRIETQFICFDAPWLVDCFEAQGFRTFWRQFLLSPVARPRSAHWASNRVVVLPWTAWNLSEMAALMKDAHLGGVDARMNELYRTSDGCRTLLNNIIRQRGCGRSLGAASAVARERSTDAAAGFAIVTEIGHRHAHLAQVAVAPEFQGRGVGHRLLNHVFARLSELGLETLSLMVSSGNERALGLYRSLGFEPTYQFPVFTRET